MSLIADIASLDPGDTIAYEAQPSDGTVIKVGYYNEQAYGDDNQPVPGATIGEFVVEVQPHTGQKRVERFPHGPAPDARAWVADSAASFVTTQFFEAKLRQKEQ